MNDSLDFGLKDKVAIVAGGGAAGQDIGNGRAASILLAQAGVKVLVVVFHMLTLSTKYSSPPT